MKIHSTSPDTAWQADSYLSNGLVGLRVGKIPLPGGTALANGFNGLSPIKRTEEYAPVPYPLGGDIQWQGVWLSQRPDLARLVRQEHDFATGELRTEFVFEVSEKSLHVEVLLFCSRTQPSLVLQEIRATPSSGGSLVLQAQIDPTGVDGSLSYRCMPDRAQDAVLQWRSRGELSTVGLSFTTTFEGHARAVRSRNDYGQEEDSQITRYEIEAIRDKPATLRQITAVVPELLHREPHWQAARLVAMGSWLGFDALREANRKAWTDLWLGRVKISGDQKWQDIVDSAYYYLHSSVCSATPCSIAPFGLSRYREYSGHVFWDTESFMFPPVLFTAPDAALAMLEYRSRRLDAARDNARLNGYRGVQFPWQSGVHGQELTSYYSGGAGGLAEQHVTLDVAFAFAQYVHVTGDEQFLREKAWPVLSGAAEWISSRVVETDRGFEIRHITGIDEGIDNVHNNAETNGLATIILREAIGFARRLGHAPPGEWTSIAREMVLPIDPLTNVLLKHDDYEYNGGICNPETLMLYFPFGWKHSPSVDVATMRYHLDLAHTYLGQPMNSCNFAVWAARSGNTALAREFLEKGTAARVIEPAMQFIESVRDLKSGCPPTIFLTACGALLNACMLGFTGLHPDSGEPSAWSSCPAVLPDGWEAITIDRVFLRGAAYSISVRSGASASLTPVNEVPVRPTQNPEPVS